MDRWTPLLLILTGAAACSEGPSAEGPPGDGGDGPGGAVAGCPPGERQLEDGTCLSAGIQPSGCAAGELADEDGLCVPAGLGPDDCGEGFVHDGDVGCEPVLPSEACGAGAWAIPGDATCRSFADSCGEGAYPQVPASEIVIHVDAAATQTPDGSEEAPYATLEEAVTAAPDGAVVVLAEGSYAGPVVVSGKAVTIWGRCAALVTLSAVGGEPALTFGQGASGSAARGLSVTGDGHAVVVMDATGVVLSDLWLHDLSGHGLHVERLSAASETTLERSLIDRATGRGVYAIGAEVTVEETAIRDTLVNDLDIGRAIDTDLQPQTGEANRVTARRIHVERAKEVGVMIHASTATMSDSLIRETLPRDSGRLGRAVNLQTDAADKPAEMTITRSVIDGAHDGGVVVSAASMTMDRVVVRNVEANLDQGIRGYAVATQGLAAAPAQLTATKSLFERAHESAVMSAGSTTLLESVVVRDTRALSGVDHPVLPAAFGGRGVTGQRETAVGIPESLTLRGSVVRDVHEVAVAGFGASLTVEGTLIEGVEPIEGKLGRGIVAQLHLDDGTPTVAQIRDSVVRRATEAGLAVTGATAEIDGVVVEEVAVDGKGINGFGFSFNHELAFDEPSVVVLRDSVARDNITAGIAVAGAEATIQHSLVRGTRIAPLAGGTYGDGIAVVSHQRMPVVTVHQSAVVDSDRVGVSSFGGFVELMDNRVECASIDLSASSFQSHDAIFDDRGGNACLCGAEERTCKALSTDLEVPEPVESF